MGKTEFLKIKRKEMRERRGKEGGEVGKGPSPTAFPARAAPEPQCPAGATSLRRLGCFAGTNPAAALAQHAGADVLGGKRRACLGKTEATCSPVPLPGAGSGSSKGTLEFLDLGL